MLEVVMVELNLAEFQHGLAFDETEACRERRFPRFRFKETSRWRWAREIGEWCILEKSVRERRWREKRCGKDERVKSPLSFIFSHNLGTSFQYNLGSFVSVHSPQTPAKRWRIGGKYHYSELGQNQIWGMGLPFTVFPSPLFWGWCQNEPEVWGPYAHLFEAFQNSIKSCREWKVPRGFSVKLNLPQICQKHVKSTTKRQLYVTNMTKDTSVTFPRIFKRHFGVSSFEKMKKLGRILLVDFPQISSNFRHTF